MKILYLGCHSVLEHQELRLLTELDSSLNEKLDIEVFSLNGSYMNPLQAGDFMRSIIPKGKFYQKLYGIALQCDKDNIHPELLEWADVVLMTHNSAIPGQSEQQRWLVRNYPLFEKMKKKVVWRSIGQSTPEIEKELMQYKKKGLRIVRYSPIEALIPNYAGHDAIIRFCEDPEEFKGWTGERPMVITITQSFKKRGEHLGFNLFEKVTDGFQRKVYGTENADLGDLWGGERTYSELKQNIREARAYFYFGTVPAPYTLTFIEAMMTGIPVVAVGSKLREMNPYKWKNYEVPDLIATGINGYVSDNIEELRGYVQLLLESPDVAKRIGEAGRRLAIELFNKRERQKEWASFLKSL